MERQAFTLGNALAHKKRVIEWVVRRCQVSILLVGDKQSEYAFHQLGYRSRKNADDLLDMPENIDFFLTKGDITIYKSNCYNAQVFML